MSIYPVYFYINTELRSLVTAAGGSSTISSLTLRRGDKLPIYVEFTATDTNTYLHRRFGKTLSSEGSLNLFCRANLDWDGYTVLSVTSFATGTTSRVSQGTTYTITHYRGSIDLSGTTLSNLFVPKNLPLVTLQSEFRWISATSGATYKQSTQPFKIIVQNEVTQ